MKAKEEAQHAEYARKKAAEQKKFVEETVDGPSGEKYKEWLKGKPANFSNCQAFLRKTGLPRTHKDLEKEIAKEMEKPADLTPQKGPATVQTQSYAIKLELASLNATV